MVGEVSVKRERMPGRGGQSRLADAVTALVAREQQLGGRLRVMRLARDIAAARLDVLERHRAVAPDERPRGPLHVELRPPDSRDVTLEELGLAAVVPRHAHAELVDIGDVVPDALVAVRLHHPRHPAEEQSTQSTWCEPQS